jgi:hypothetical protein
MKSLEAVRRIEKCLEDYTGGCKNTQALAIISVAISDIDHEAGHYTYVQEKLVHLREWIGKLYSPRKHAPWGIDQVRSFAIGDCRRITMYLNSRGFSGEPQQAPQMDWNP